METLEQIDRNLFLFLNDCHAPWLDTIMWYVSTTVLWIPLFLFFLLYAYRKGGVWMAVTLLLGAAVCIALTDLTSVHLFKEVFLRYRPTHNLEIGDMVKTVVHNGNEYRGGTYGFISSHAANYAGLATFMFLLFRTYSKWWLLLFFWMVLIGYSRIYLGVHYPADILGGFIVGALAGFLVYKLAHHLVLKKKVPLAAT